MNDFIQYAYSWHAANAVSFLVAGAGCGFVLAATRKRKLMAIIFCTLFWIIGVYPLYIMGNYNRWQDNVEACMEHPSYHMRSGVCYRPVDGYVPVSTWVINKDLSEDNGMSSK